MIRALALVLLALALASCGVDGEPVPPSAALSVSGSAYAGIAGRL